MPPLRTTLRRTLSALDMVEFVRDMRSGVLRVVRILTLSRFRHRRQERLKFRRFSDQFSERLRPSAGSRTTAPDRGRALIVGRNIAGARGMVALARVLEIAGFRPTVLNLHAYDGLLNPYYELAGVTDVVNWAPVAAEAYAGQARSLLRECTTARDVLSLEYKGVFVGRAALSSTLQQTQVGLQELELNGNDARLVTGLAHSLAAADAASAVMTQWSPALTISYEMEYTPKREVFDAALAAGGVVVATSRAARRQSFLVKRYVPHAPQSHPSAPSETTWQALCRAPWTDVQRQALLREVQQSYTAGDWWDVPTSRTAMEDPDAASLCRQLGLDPARKIAGVFPHVPWDASFCWGTDLFEDYQTWLVETIRAACDNPAVNWIVRIHPANLRKSRALSDRGESIEVTAIRERVGPLPGHIVIIPPDAALRTPALLDVMDYCLTVRGTVGIEAAGRGIPVLTAGTGRYDHRGFTIDSNSPQDYLERLRCLQDIPPMGSTAIELAERFAYGMFVQRSIPLRRSLEACLDSSAVLHTAIQKDPLLVAWIEWLRDQSAEDFLMPEGSVIA